MNPRIEQEVAEVAESFFSVSSTISCSNPAEDIEKKLSATSAVSCLILGFMSRLPAGSTG